MVVAFDAAVVVVVASAVLIVVVGSLGTEQYLVKYNCSLEIQHLSWTPYSASIKSHNDWPGSCWVDLELWAVHVSSLERRLFDRCLYLHQ